MKIVRYLCIGLTYTYSLELEQKWKICTCSHYTPCLNFKVCWRWMGIHILFSLQVLSYLTHSKYICAQKYCTLPLPQLNTEVHNHSFFDFFGQWLCCIVIFVSYTCFYTHVHRNETGITTGLWLRQQFNGNNPAEEKISDALPPKAIVHDVADFRNKFTSKSHDWYL